MSQLAPSGPVYQAGTLSGNPLATAAALVALRRLRDASVYEDLEQAGRRLAEGLQAAAVGQPACVQRVGSMATLFFQPGPVRDFEGATESDTERYGAFFRHLLARGVYAPPSQFEAMFLSTAHGEAEIDLTVDAAAEFFGS
jgi:glutamate-1-semialdehyde 2,1-aminomutase